jgi:hypothetical protein
MRTAAEAQGHHLNLLYVPTEGEEFQETQLLAQDGEVLSDVDALMKRKDITLNHKMSQPLAVSGCYLGMLLSGKMQSGAEERAEYLREMETELVRVGHLLRRIAEMEEIRTVEYLAEKRMVEVEEDEDPKD